MFGFFTLDTDLRIRQWNPWLAEWTGRKPDEVEGRPLLEVFPDMKERGIADIISYALEFSAPMTLSWRFHRYIFPSASGETVPQSGLVQPLYDRDKVTGMIVAVQDVRDRQVAEEELRLRIRELETLHELDRLILRNDVDAVLQTLVERVAELFDALHAEVFLLEGERLVLRAAHNWPAGATQTNLAIGDGIVGQVALQRRSFFSLDVSRESTYLPIDPRTRAEGAVPIISEAGRLYGVLNMESAHPERLISGGVQDFLETLGQQIAIAIENAEAQRREQKRLKTLTHLRDLGVQLAGTQRITDVYDLTAQAAQHVFETKSLLLYALDADDEEEAVIGAAQPVDLFSQVPPTLPREYLSDLQAAVVWPAGEQPAWFPLPAGEAHTLAVFPLRSQERLLAVLFAAFSERWVVNAADVHALALLSEQLGAQIHAWRLQRESLQRLRELDALHVASQRLREAEDAMGVLGLTLESAMDVLDVPCGAVLLLRQGRAFLEIAHLRCFHTLEDSRQRAFPLETSLAGQVIQAGKPRMVRRVRHEALLGAAPPPEMETSEDALMDALMVPLFVPHGAFSALFLLAAPPHRRLNEDDLRLLDTLVQMAGIAGQRAYLRRRTKQQVARLMSLSQVTATVNASMDLSLSLAVLLDEAQKQLGVDAAAVYLFSAPERRLKMVAHSGLPPAPPGAWDVYPLNEPLSRQVRIVLDLQAQQISGGLYRPLRQAGFRTCASIPLIVKGTARGMLVCLSHQVFQPDSYWVEFSEILGRVTAMAVDMSEMFSGLERANTELRIAYDATIEGWAKALELRDNETKGHSDRVTDMTVQLAGLMGFDAEQLTYVRWGALLHDIGKMGIPDSILHKPGPLTDEEWQIMRMHPVYAYNLLREIEFLGPAIDIPYCHHEKWDGSGYPQGLRGEQIPLAARLFAIVDVWDALRSDRPYRKAWPREKACRFIMEQSGIHFDPEVVRLFLRLIGEKE
ncbi:MAG: GAF domain-containing protein [Anaerolineae bacterium]|nr:MAG: GAF domain-containing protein [Anaerolineae bacterium]